jgi:prepilin-type N-terminal cleavage/methylation domain-containing protein
MALLKRAPEAPSFGSRARSLSGGFTLVELMVVVSIIAILASIFIPKYADLITKSQEGGTKGNLASIRSSLSVYYADNQGAYPVCAFGPASSVLTASLVPKYLTGVQMVQTGLHSATSSVFCDSAMTAGNVHDGQGWYYDGDVTDSRIGYAYVACDHTDTKGNFWSSY